MKKVLIGVSATVLLLVGVVFTLRNVNYNRIGKDQYYVQIVGEGSEVESQDTNGNIYVDYEYELPGYNKNGEEKELVFTAKKQLREEAYLQIYVKDKNVVTSYQEVQEDELPEKAAEALE